MGTVCAMANVLENHHHAIPLAALRDDIIACVWIDCEQLSKGHRSVRIAVQQRWRAYHSAAESLRGTCIYSMPLKECCDR